MKKNIFALFGDTVSLILKKPTLLLFLFIVYIIYSLLIYVVNLQDSQSVLSLSVLSLLISFIWIFLYFYSFILVQNVVDKGYLNFLESLKLLGARFWRLLLLLLLIYVISFGLFLILGVASAFAVVFSLPPTISSIFFGIGYGLILIILYYNFILSAFIIIFEEKKVREVMRRNRELIRNNRNLIASSVFVMFLMGAIAYTLFANVRYLYLEISVSVINGIISAAIIIFWFLVYREATKEVSAAQS